MVNRNSRRGGFAPAAFALLILAAGPAAAPAGAQIQCDPCGVGVVFDGPWERNQAAQAGLEEEISALAAPGFNVVFPSSAQRTGDWTLAGTQSAVEALLANPAVHIVLTYGPVASSYAAGRDQLPKPVVAAFVLDPQAQGFPIQAGAAGERASGSANLAYVTFAGDWKDEIRRLQEIVPFQRLTYLVHDELLASVPALADNLGRRLKQASIEAAFVPVGTSADTALAALPPETEAVYVTPLRQLASGEFDRLVNTLIERRIPAFSYLGKSEVNKGLLASVHIDTDLGRLARRLALHVQRILSGEDPGSLPVDFRRDNRLTLNMATARAIGVYPGWRVMTEAELVDNAPPRVSRRLSLVRSAQEAVTANLDLAAARQSVAAGRESVRAARGALLPQIGASGGFEQIDLGGSSLELDPVRAWTGSLGLSQILYSDSAWARVAVEGQVQISREQARDELRLDVAHEATVAYLNALRARAGERIQRENLILTRSNLELARTRRRIGVARASEVIRWENQIANNRRAVLEATAARNATDLALNRLLHRPLEEPFEAAEVNLDNPALLADATTVDNYMDNLFAFALFRDFMTKEALSLSPELRQLDAAIAAGERTVLAARRARWAPTVSLGANLTELDVSGGLDAMDTPALPFSLARPNGRNWTVGVSASLPLFTGGTRRAEQTRAERELDELRLARRAAAERIEQRLRTAMHHAGASYAGIGLAGDAADAARRNLALVTEAYEQGALSILELIDAQNAALVAEESAATAVYDYLIDLMGAHRASGRFGLLMEPGEVADFHSRLRAFFRDAGYEPSKRR